MSCCSRLGAQQRHAALHFAAAPTMPAAAAALRFRRTTRAPAAAKLVHQQHTAEPVLQVDASPFIGPIQVANIEGAGRGVVVTRDVQPGELLLCCHPLAVVTGPQQQRLTVEQLQVQLASNISPTVTAWLDELFDGTEQSTQHLPDFQAAAAVQKQQQEQAHLLQALREQQQLYGASSSSSGGGAVVPQLPLVTDALLQHIMDVVRFNAYSDLHDDLAAAAAAGQQPVSLIGLYPEFSYLNHSCVPNAINWVLPGHPRAMVVRAATHIPAGAEATISYLGGPQLLPLEGRREALGNFGFRCRCSRCTAEEEVPADVAELMEGIVSRVSQSFAPRMAAALADGGDAQGDVAVVQQQASAMMQQLYGLFRRHRIHPVLRKQLLASCFCCLELLADAAEAQAASAAQAAAGGGGDSGGESSSSSSSSHADSQEAVVAALRKCLEAAAAVTPGSDLHCILAAKLEAASAAASADADSGDSAMLAAALDASSAAHTARYGQLTEQQLQQLSEYNRTLYV